uniref:VWFA domain-containing protein n=1 Tax=Naja naja TaxID=35670 RepID=A0A8C6Y3P4_NAJNA
KMLLTLLLVILGTQASKTQQPASESVDVVLLIDSSNTFGRQGFLSLKNYVNRMINNLPIGPNKYRLALVQYSDDIHAEFQLDDFRGKNPMLNHVKKTFSFRGGSLRTGNAIQKIHKTIFKAPRRDRHQVLIITTSGVSQDNVQGPATLMREDGVKIIALGMLNASEQELKSMATHPFSYHFDTLKDLQKFSSNILKETVKKRELIMCVLFFAVADCSDDLIADVVFVVDAAVLPTNSEYIVSFLQNTTTSLDVQKSCIRIGLVTYSNEPRILSQLNTETEIKDLIFKIKSFSPREGKAKLGAALNFTREIIFTESAGSRRTEGVEQIATIITHRPSEDSVTEASSLLLQKGVTVFAISIEGANITQLGGVVSYPPNRNIIKVDHFSNLADKSKIFEKKLFKHIHMLFAEAERTEEFRSGCMETEKADIYFLIDGSSSISPSNFIKMKTFLKEVIKLFTIGPDHVRFGVVQFGTLYQTEFELDKYMKISHLEKAINNIIQMGVDTYTGAAIWSMQPLFEKAKKQRGGKVPCYLIVLTDGEAHDNVLEPSKMLRKSAVNIYAIGVKPANITQLNEIADTESKVYYVEQFDSLKNIKNEIVQDICSEKACEKMKADVMFLVDSSGSISHQDFEKMKKFMQELVDKCSVGLDEVQFGVVQFSSTNKEEFQLNSSKDYIINAIRNMAQMEQNTYTGKALQFVSDYFKPAKGARPSVNKILILLTDGEAHDNVREPASALRKEGVIIYSIGITGANVTQLVEISGAPNNMFYLKDYDVLKYIEKDIMFRICSPYKLDECKRINRLDLVFVIDSSSSIGETNYILMSNFIIGIVNKSDVGKEHVQFGAVKYSNNPEIMFKLNTYSKRSDIIKFIQDNTLLKGDTYTAKALQLSKSLLTKENGSRIHQGVPQVLMVITDGESHDRAILDSVSNELRKKGTIIYAIGIKDANREELEIMAGSKDYWFYMPSFEGLENITTNLSNQLSELVILADSRSIPDKELKGVKDFVINLLKSIINKDNILVGMAQFSNTLQEVFQLGAYQNLPELYSKITNMSLITGGSTLIGRALREVKTFFKTSKQRVARSVNQKLLIFTDGRSDDEFPQAAKKLRDEGVEIHAVAVGNVTDSKLLQITNSPSRKYKVDHYSDLKTLVNHVNKEICKETTEATCFVDIIIGFDMSSQKPGNNLFSKQHHLEIYLPDIIKGLTSLSSTSCSKDKKAQFSVTISVENTDKPFWAKFHYVDDTNIVTELRNVVVNRPSHLNTDFLDAIWNLVKNVTDIENRNTVIYFHLNRLDGLITVALEGAKDIDQLQHIEFGKGFGYNTQLSIDTENVAMRLFQYMDQIAEQKCCCIFCRCEGEEGPRGKRREKGHRYAYVTHFCLLCFVVLSTFVTLKSPKKGRIINYPKRLSSNIVDCYLWARYDYFYNLICFPGIPKCPAYPTELVFALDISQDTNPEIFEEMKKTVIDIVNQTNIRESNCPVGARVAVVSYSSNTNYLIRFTDFQSKDKLLQELNRLYLQRTTNRRDIGGSMRFVARHLFKRTLQGANVRKVAVFFSNGESDHPDSIGTAVLEFSALGIQPAVISFKNIPEITQAFEMDSTGLFQVIHLHQKSDYLSVLERLQMCVICYDKCRPDESCFRTPLFEPEAYMDAAFILENSRKISITGFEELKHFLSRALDSFEISTNPKTSLIGDRIAVVSHAPPNFQFQRQELSVKIEFDLVTYESKKQMKRHIEKSFQKLNGEAALGHAIKWTIDNIFSEGRNQREKKAIFIISVGETSHWDKEVLSDAALRAKCEGYAVFVLSVGPQYDYIELMELSSLPLEHHIVQLGRIHKAELEYAVKFLKPLIHLLKSKLSRFITRKTEIILKKRLIQSYLMQIKRHKTWVEFFGLSCKVS